MTSLCKIICSLGCFKSIGNTDNDTPQKTSEVLDKQLKDWSKDYDSTIKILLLGSGESGKSTICKQMKILHIQGFNESERIEKAKEIHTNIFEATQILIREMDSMNISLKNESNNSSLEYFRNLQDTKIFTNFEFTVEFFDHLRKFWTDEGMNDCFLKSEKLPDNAKYFLSRLDQISTPNYIPSDQDILYSRKTTTDIQKIEFQMDIPKKHGGGVQNFWMFDVGGQKGERRKWIQVFDGINTILFLVACNIYDQVMPDDPQTNRLQESINLFQDIWSSRFLKDSGFIVFLNKMDLLKQKVEKGPSIAKFFPAYNNYKYKKDSTSTSSYNGDTRDQDEYLKTRSFIRDMFGSAKVSAVPPTPRKITFTRGFSYLEEDFNASDREVYWHFTTATDSKNINLVFKDVQMFIIQNHLKSLGLT